MSADDLWAKVSPEAKWQRCREHGEVKRPELSEKTFANGTKHIEAACPLCRRGLGFLAQKKATANATVDEKQAAYRRYLAEAKAHGYRPGQAYFRFKADYGHDPEASWKEGA